MKSLEEEVLPIGISPPQAKNFAHFRVLRGNLAKSLTTGRPFLGGQCSKFGGGGPKHTLAHPLKLLGGHGPPVPPSLLTSHQTIFINRTGN